MYFSLVMGTLARTEEITRFLEKLDAQNYRDFELIVVDQNEDDRLVKILEPFQNSFPIVHLRTPLKGVSRARNLGIRAAQGEIIAFPDDDCWYTENLLEKVARLLEENTNWGGLSVTTANDEYWSKNSGLINQFNVWKRVIEYGIFLRRDLVAKVGYFDETIGPGAGTQWWAGEIADYMLRVLNAGYCVYYEPALAVYHPGPIQTTPSTGFSTTKSYHYALGKGRVLRKSNAPLWFVAYQCGKPLVNLLLGSIQQRPEKKQMSWDVFKGIVQGWRGLT